MSQRWDKITISYPKTIDEDKVTGDGWTLDLNQGYSIEKELTSGNYILKKK